MPGNVIELNGKFRCERDKRECGERMLIRRCPYCNSLIVDCPYCGADMEPNVRAKLKADPAATHEVCRACGAELEIGGLFGKEV